MKSRIFQQIDFQSGTYVCWFGLCAQHFRIMKIRYNTNFCHNSFQRNLIFQQDSHMRFNQQRNALNIFCPFGFLFSIFSSIYTSQQRNQFGFCFTITILLTSLNMTQIKIYREQTRAGGRKNRFEAYLLEHVGQCWFPFNSFCFIGISLSHSFLCRQKLFVAYSWISPHYYTTGQVYTRIV